MKIFDKILVLGLLGVAFHAQAQLNPLGAQYFQNQYLANPAMAGLDKGYEIFGALKAQWTAIDGAPLMQAITLTRGSENKKVGLGLFFYSESSGVIGRTSVKGSYAYHLPLQGEDSYLDFGLSAGYMKERIDWNKVIGEYSDVSLTNFNERKLYFDADFGMAFRTRKITIEAALPNLKRLFVRDIIRTVADRSTYMASVGYKLALDGENTQLEPKIMYRGIQNYKDIVDVGANVSFNGGKLIFNGVYHSTNSVTIGAGTTYKGKLGVLCQYTTNTSAFQNYSNGEAEIGLKYRF